MQVQQIGFQKILSMSSHNKATLIAAAGTLILAGLWANKFHSMLVQTHLPLWAIVLLCLPGAIILGFVWLAWWLFNKDTEVRPRWFAVPLFLFSIFFSIWVAHRGADHFFLLYMYGPSRVQSEQLHLVRTGKNNPWPVVSGSRQIDSIMDHQVWMDINDAIEAAVFFATFTPIFCLLPRKSSGPLIIWIWKSTWSKH
jgi:hypothetical protein